MIILKKLIFSLIFLIFFLLYAVFFFTFTNNGFYLLAKSIIYDIPNLKVESISGNVNNILINKFYYKTKNTFIKFNKFYLSLNINYLFKKKIFINDFSLKDSLIKINLNYNKNIVYKSEKKNKNYSFYNINFININNLNITNFYLKINNFNISFNKFITGFNIKEKNFLIKKTNIIGLTINLPKKKEKSYNLKFKKKFLLKNKMNSKNKYKNNYIFKNINKFKKNKNIYKKKINKLNNFYFPWNLNIKSINIENLHFNSEKKIFLKKLYLKANIYNKYLNLDKLYIDLNHLLINIFGNIKLNNNLPLNITIYIKYNIFILNKEKLKILLHGNLYNKIKYELDFSGIFNIKISEKFFPKKILLPLIKKI